MRRLHLDGIEAFPNPFYTSEQSICFDYMLNGYHGSLLMDYGKVKECLREEPAPSKKKISFSADGLRTVIVEIKKISLPSMNFKKLLLAVPAVALVLMGAGCSDADIASQNLSTAADNFEIARRIVFYNGINGEYMLTIEGYCSLGNADPSGQLSVTCKVGEGQYKKHFLGLSDNVTYFVEQVDSAKVSADFYKVIFKPVSIIPDIDLK